jgi:hypothetical protein
MMRAVVPTLVAAAVVVVATASWLIGHPVPWYVAGGGVLIACWAVVAAALARSRWLLAAGLLALLGCGALAVYGVVERHQGPDDVFEGFGPKQRRPDAR